MADQFLGEIRIVPFDFAPTGWAQCDGQLLAISQSSALFSLLGTYYGGNGQSNFALPNFQGNIPVAYGDGPGLSQRVLGETGGNPTVQLNLSTLASHTHVMNGDSNAATSTSPAGNLTATPATGPRRPNQMYDPSAVNTGTQAGDVDLTGGNQPHNNLQPFLVMNFVISLTGIYPSRG
ncbi:MAG: tail fiber protein [Capsulimonas sp.]|uniref:phage tail protein n=1 Tax=Capsulimonas sp. TaxID=2494211 RepID=UPI00326307A0